MIGLPFANSFDFGRPSAAPVRAANGELVTAPVDQARFDHDDDGNRLGLLIEAGDILGQQDRLTSVGGDWTAAETATVLLEWMGTDSVVRRRATYSRRVKATVDAALATLGHLRFIAAVAGFLPPQQREDQSLYVRFSERSWELGAALVDGGGTAIVDQGGRLLIESS